MVLREQGQRAVENDHVRGVPGREDIAPGKRQVGIHRGPRPQSADAELHDPDRDVQHHQRRRDEDHWPHRPGPPGPPKQPRDRRQRGRTALAEDHVVIDEREPLRVSAAQMPMLDVGIDLQQGRTREDRDR